MELATIIHAYGYPVFFALAVVEGPIVTVIASFFASVGFFNIFLVLLISVIGDIVGDLIYYNIGFYGKRKFLNEERFLGFRGERVLGLQQHFEQHGGKTLLLGKLTHGVGFTILIASGVAEMPISRFLFFTILGTIPKSMLFVALGFYFGKAYSHIDSLLSYLKFVFIAVTLFSLLYLLVKKLIKKYRPLWFNEV